MRNSESHGEQELQIQERAEFGEQESDAKFGEQELQIQKRNFPTQAPIGGCDVPMAGNVVLDFKTGSSSPNTFKIVLAESDLITNEVRRSSRWENSIAVVIERIYAESTMPIRWLIDIGANRGTHTLLMASFDKARVIAIEAMPRNMEALKGMFQQCP